MWVQFPPKEHFFPKIWMFRENKFNYSQCQQPGDFIKKCFDTNKDANPASVQIRTTMIEPGLLLYNILLV